MGVGEVPCLFLLRWSPRRKTSYAVNVAFPFGLRSPYDMVVKASYYEASKFPSLTGALQMLAMRRRTFDVYYPAMEAVRAPPPPRVARRRDHERPLSPTRHLTVGGEAHVEPTAWR